MRIPSLGALCAPAFLTALSGAQTEFVLVSKFERNEQTSATQVAHIPVRPWNCDLTVVDGPGLTPAPSVSGPIGVGEPFHNGGVLLFNDDWQEWAYGAPNADNYGTATLTELDSLFGSGTYTFNVSGVSVPLNLTGDLYSANAPVLTVTGGMWQGGKYILEESQSLTITTSAFLEWGTHVEDAIALALSGCDYEQNEMVFAMQGGGPNWHSITIPSGALTRGQTYNCFGGFMAFSDVQATIPGLPGAVGAAFYSRDTEFDVLVVPDGGLLGSTYCTPSNVNSSGMPGVLLVGGSDSVAANGLTLLASDLPTNQFGFFLNSLSQGFIANPGGSQGNLCLTSGIGRYSRPGEIKNSGACGSFALDVDLTNTPTPLGSVGIQPGETWNFQAWFRDQNPTNTSNFTDAVTVTFQ